MILVVELLLLVNAICSVNDLLLDGFSLDHGLDVLMDMAGPICKILVHGRGIGWYLLVNVLVLLRGSILS